MQSIYGSSWNKVDIKLIKSGKGTVLPKTNFVLTVNLDVAAEALEASF